MQGFGAVVAPGGEEPYHHRWEQRVFAMSLLVGIEGVASGSGRRARELMPPDEYLRAGYYDRWLWATERRLERKGTIAPGDVEGWVERLRAGEKPPRSRDRAQAERGRSAILEAAPPGGSARPRFRSGDAVRVTRMRPVGHTRCPRYVRGVVGLVQRVQGVEPFPDDGAQRGSSQPVYAVAFRSVDLFGETSEPPWTVRLDLYEPYLEPE
jgi:nitrile hydratase